MSEHTLSDLVHDDQLPSSTSPFGNQDSTAPQAINNPPLLSENLADSASTHDNDATGSTGPSFTLGQAPTFWIGPPSTTELSLTCNLIQHSKPLYSKSSFRLREGHCVRRRKPANLQFLTDLQYYRLLGYEPPPALVVVLGVFSSGNIPSETFVSIQHLNGLFRTLHWRSVTLRGWLRTCFSLKEVRRIGIYQVILLPFTPLQTSP